MALSKGDRVAWERQLGPLLGVGSTVRAEALKPEVPLGIVLGPAEDTEEGAEPGSYAVRFDKGCRDHPEVQEAAGTHPDEGVLVLTRFELVKVEG